jgi:hemerythrin-like domain-containing protein
MLYEHDRGRALLTIMEGVLPHLRDDAIAREDFVNAARNYVTLLSQHIFKENNVLFKMAESVLSDEDDARLFEEFERREREERGAGEHEKFHQFIHDLEHELFGAQSLR